jgi:hypothetical protein
MRLSIRHELSPEALAALEKVMDAVDGLEADDCVHIAHNLLCLALLYLPESRRQGFIEGMETSVPRTIGEFFEANKERRNLQ